MRKALLVGLALLVAGILGVAQRQVLHVYTALDVDEARIYIEAFEAAHPEIDVEWVRLSAGELLARLRAEAGNPQASLWFGGPSDTFIVAKMDGLLAPYTESLGWQYLPDRFKDPEGYWVGIYLGFIGFVSNTDFLAAHGLEPPRSWEDLLRPEFEGELSMAFPYTSGTGYTRLATLVFLLGEEEALEFERRIAEHIHHFTKSGSACVTEVGLGEVAVGVAFAHDILAKGVAKGYPVTLSFPEEGTGYEVGGLALIAGSPELELAKVFYDWLLSAEAQSLFQGWYRLPLNPEAELAEGLVTADQLALVDYDALWAAQNRDRLVELWREVTGF
jgi:iron(III) transport system substrate-binding protein